MEECNACGKGVRTPQYARENEESVKLAPYHKKCLERLIRTWDRENNGTVQKRKKQNNHV